VERRRAAFAIVVGTIAGLYAWLGIVIHRGSFVPDFQFFWSSARILLSGGNPYVGFPTPVPDPLYYPLPTVLAAVAVAWLPLALAAGVAVGISAAVLAWVIPSWRWPMFASAAFVMAASQGQWSPLIVVGALVPAAGFLAVLKPNLGLAAFAYRPTVWGIVLAGLALLVSIAALPRPLVPAQTKTVSDAETFALPTSICHAVMYVFGNAATCSSGTEGSTGTANRAGTRKSSAYVPL
jgi:hypothetical protein